jgi:hypothetical protein
MQTAQKMEAFYIGMNNTGLWGVFYFKEKKHDKTSLPIHRTNSSLVDSEADKRSHQAVRSARRRHLSSPRIFG